MIFRLLERIRLWGLFCGTKFSNSQSSAPAFVSCRRNRIRRATLLVLHRSCNHEQCLTRTLHSSWKTTENYTLNFPNWRGDFENRWGLRLRGRLETANGYSLCMAGLTAANIWWHGLFRPFSLSICGVRLQFAKFVNVAINDAICVGESF